MIPLYDYKSMPRFPSTTTRECPDSLLRLRGHTLIPFYDYKGACRALLQADFVPSVMKAAEAVLSSLLSVLDDLVARLCPF